MPATPLRTFVVCYVVTVSAAYASGAFAQATTTAAPPATTTPDAGKSGATTGTSAVVIEGSAAETLLGKPVQSLKGEDLGRIVDVIVDRAGMTRAAIIDFGGFLGVGTRKIAVDWHVLHFSQDGSMDKLIADLSRDQVRKAPIFKEGEPAVIMGATTGPPSLPTAAAAPTPFPAAPATSPETSPPAPKL